MSTPVLHLLAGPNGAGKSTLAERVLVPVTGLPFVNADHIAARLLEQRASFITETVFSHPSKLELVAQAVSLGYLVHLHVLLIPVELSVARVAERVRRGGHDVPEDKIRQRHARLWTLVASARGHADRTVFYDNTRASAPFREVATFQNGLPIGEPQWPDWTPVELR